VALSRKVLWLAGHSTESLNDDLANKVVSLLGEGCDKVWVNTTNPGQTLSPTWSQRPRLEWQRRLRERAHEAGKSVSFVVGHRVECLGPPKDCDSILLDHPDWVAKSPVRGWRDRWREAGWTWGVAEWCHKGFWERVALNKDAVLYTTSADPVKKRITFSGVVGDLKRPLYRGWAISHAWRVCRMLEADIMLQSRKGYIHFTGRLLTPSDPTLSGLVCAPEWSKLNLEGYYDQMLGKVNEALPVMTLTHPAASIRWSPSTVESMDCPPEVELVRV
jgi:hypothetical protein